MGNYRFRLSDMVPHSWLYKLKDMSKIKSKNQSQTTKKKPTSSSPLSSTSSSIFSSLSNPQKTQTQQQPRNLSYQRKSYYISRNLNDDTTLSENPNNSKFLEPPRKSSKKKRNTTKEKTSTVSASCSCSLESAWTQHNDSNSPFSFSSTTSSEQESSIHSPKTFDAMIMSIDNDLVIDMNKNDLPPIITKPKKHQDSTKRTKKNDEKIENKSLKGKIVKEEQITTTSPKRRVSVSSSNGVKLRTKSPRIASRKSVSSSTRRSSVGESFAVVKSSQDPQKDFKESMVEMIMENNIRKSKDLEELLACYLSLNSDQYHDLIIKVFKQIWLDITDIHLK